MRNNKRAQEEIVGFVAIVVLVAVIALVLLSFSFRKGAEANESVAVAQLLSSMNEYTTGCEVGNAVRGVALGRLYDACRTEGVCGDGRNACDVLNETSGDIIVNALRPAEDRPVKGYRLSAVLVGNLTLGANIEPFFVSNYGNCSQTREKGTSDLRPSGGRAMRISLQICS